MTLLMLAPSCALTCAAQTDYTSMALGAGPLDVPLGPLQALSTFLPNDASPLAAETESILKNLRTIQEQAWTSPEKLSTYVTPHCAGCSAILFKPALPSKPALP